MWLGSAMPLRRASWNRLKFVRAVWILLPHISFGRRVLIVEINRNKIAYYIKYIWKSWIRHLSRECKSKFLILHSYVRQKSLKYFSGSSTQVRMNKKYIRRDSQTKRRRHSLVECDHDCKHLTRDNNASKGNPGHRSSDIGGVHRS